MLALFECGRAGRFGHEEPWVAMSLLWSHAHAVLGMSTANTTKDAQALEAVTLKYQELLAAFEHELQVCDLVRRAEEDTARAVRRAARRQEAAERRSQPKVDSRAPNRPTRVDVDPAAWALVKQRAIADGRKVAEVVGSLLEGDLGSLRSHRSSHIARRNARLFVSPERWAELRAVAVDHDITVARLVGIVVEREAKRFGWTPEAVG